MSDAMPHPDASSLPGAHLDDSALVEHLDGELDEADRDRYDRHLAECANCAARLTELRTISQLLSDTHRAIDVPPRLLQRPPRRVGARQPWRPTRRPGARSVPRVAALVFFVALAAATSRPVRAAVLRARSFALERVDRPFATIPRRCVAVVRRTRGGLNSRRSG